MDEAPSPPNGMLLLGYLLTIAGVIYIFIAFNMDVSVSMSSTYVPGYGSVGGGEIANIELIARRQNHLIIASLVTAVGALFAIFGHRNDKPPAVQSPAARSTNKPFEGERDLASDPYRLWLVETYGVARNEVLDRFIVGETTFASLDEALIHVHGLEQHKIDQAKEKADQIRLRREELAEAERLRAAREEAEWQRLKPKLVVGAILGVVALVLAYFMFKETPEERQARLAREETERVQALEAAEKKFGISLPDDTKTVEITENAGDLTYLCDGRLNGSVLRFSTALGQKQIRDSLSKNLGVGHATYEILPDKFDWWWDKRGKRYTLTMIGEKPPTAANLCMTDESGQE